MKPLDDIIRDSFIDHVWYKTRPVRKFLDLNRITFFTGEIRIQSILRTDLDEVFK